MWSLGSVGTQEDVALLVRGLSDRDVAVAANAAASLGRLVRRKVASSHVALCAALDDSRTGVRANALTALTLSRGQCEGVDFGAALLNDRAPLVRRAAAEWLKRRAEPTKEEARYLERCAANEPDGRVAAACSGSPEELPDSEVPVTVYVVAPGREEPAPVRQPFTLVRGDGLMRLGLTDRRGAVFEIQAPRAPLRLEVPAYYR
jgi:hypothetical protein